MAHLECQGDHRGVLGRGADGGSALLLRDTEGRNRILLRVAPDGVPKLQLRRACRR